MINQVEHWLLMLFRLFLILSFSIVLLQAQSNIGNVEILAKNLSKEGNIVHAKDDVVLYSDKYIITADEAYYDNNSSDLELIGDITIMEGSTFSSRSGYAKLNMNSDSGSLTPMFGFTGSSKIWIKCNEAEFDARYYITKNAIVSSCNVQDPDWKIGFTSGKYDKEDQYISTFNTLFYLDKVPVFYLPYFGFSTDTTRRTGLLIPEFSFGSDEGLYYMQPIYFAPQDSWDVQLDPQIRTKRGAGIRGTLRFADSPYSKGKITVGQFIESSDYMEKNNLRNNKHYGYTVEYDRSKLFSGYFSEKVEDGLWIDFQYLNDVDYLNTVDNSDSDYDALVQSTMNYYMKRDLDYIGLYAKYYIDTSKDSNDDIVQELPTFQYHRFTSSILEDNIFYSIDYSVSNYTSKSGLEFVSNQIDAPIGIHFSFLDDFFQFKFSEHFYLANVDYDEGVKAADGHIVQNYHDFSLYTELAKPYEDFLHTMYFGVNYILPGNISKSDGWKELENDLNLDEFDSLILNTKEHVSFNLIEFFYNKQGRMLVSHSLRQSILMGDLATNEYKYQDISNDLKIYFTSNLTLKNLLYYSYEFSRFSKFQTSFDWKLDEYKTSFIHTYQKDKKDKVDNYLTLSLDTDYVQNYNFFTSLSYDVEDSFFKSWQVGWKMQKKCWDYRIMYKEEIEPDSSSNGSTNTNGIYLIFNLYPIGGISYDFTKDGKSAP